MKVKDEDGKEQSVVKFGTQMKIHKGTGNCGSDIQCGTAQQAQTVWSAQACS